MVTKAKTVKKSPAKKKALAKMVKKQAAKKSAAKMVKHEIVLHVDTTPQRPTETDLAAPMTVDGKNLTVRKSWISESQLHRMLQNTPSNQVYRRKGKGNQEFDYVTGSYCIKWLNFIFAWDWDFEIVEHGQEKDHVWCLGKLTVRGEKAGQSISKTQFGRSDVKQLKAGGNVDYGNDLKAAATDSMKKCASMLGFASDIYGKADYKRETGTAPLPAAQQSRPYPQQESVVQIGEPVCTETMPNGTIHGVKITKQQADDSLKLTGSELCKIHLNARLDR